MIKKILFLAVVVFLSLLVMSIVDVKANDWQPTYTICKLERLDVGFEEVCKVYASNTQTPTVKPERRPKEQTSTPTSTLVPIDIPLPTRTQRPTPTYAPTYGPSPTPYIVQPTNTPIVLYPKTETPVP